MNTSISVPQLETEHLRFDPLSHADEADVFHVFSNEDVIRYFGQDRMTDIGQARFWVSVQLEMRNLGLGMAWVMRDKASGAVAGTFCFDGINRQWHNVGISYGFHPDFWGRGLASEALTMLTELAFSGALGSPMHRIQALVFDENLPSIRVLKKLGFMREGRRIGLLFWQQRYWDLESYCLINPD